MTLSLLSTFMKPPESRMFWIVTPVHKLTVRPVPEGGLITTLPFPLMVRHGFNWIETSSTCVPAETRIGRRRQAAALKALAESV